MPPKKPQLHTLTIFDLDDTLAEGSEELITPPYLDYLYDEILLHRPNLTRAEYDETTKVFNAHGLGTYQWAEHLGFSPLWAEKLHASMARTLANAFTARGKPASNEVRAGLSHLAFSGHALAILTHGYIEYALIVVPHLGLARFFPPENIFDITTNGGTLKSSVATYRHVVQVMEERNGAPFQHLNMVEDNPRNLIAAKEAGFNTFMVGTRYSHPRQHEVVDTFLPSVVDSFTHLQAVPA